MTTHDSTISSAGLDYTNNVTEPLVTEVTSMSTIIHDVIDESSVPVVVFALTVVALILGFAALAVVLVVYFRKKLEQSSNGMVRYVPASVHGDTSEGIYAGDGTLYIPMNSQRDSGDSGIHSPRRTSLGNIPEPSKIRAPESFKDRIKFFWKKGTVKEESSIPTYANIDIHKKQPKTSGGAIDSTGGLYYSVNTLRNDRDVQTSSGANPHVLYENVR